MNKKGFTLMELLIVIAIIGILATIAIPGYIGQQRRAARTEAYSNLQNLRLLEEQYFAENGCYYKVGVTCTNATIGPDAPVVGGGVANIRTFLPGFKPGTDTDLNYTYSIATTGTTATAFTATAAGKTGKKVAGDNYTINQDNVKGGGW